MFHTIFLLGVLIFFVNGQTLEDGIKDGCYRSDDSSSVCDHADDYPREVIQRALANYGDVFGKVHNEPTLNVTENQAPCTLCKIKVSYYMKPQMLMKNGAKCYVVNTKNYHPAIIYNICETNQESSICLKKNGDQDLSLGLETQCHQKNTLIKLLCYDPNTASIKPWGIKYPSSCQCVVGS